MKFSTMRDCYNALMPKNRYLVLLRGINVGGNNSIKMAALRECLEGMGFTDIQTYIQSGNIVLTSMKTAKATISTIEKGLSKTFKYEVPVFLLTRKQLKEVVQDAPNAFGAKTGTYRYDVIFTRKPLTPKKAIQEVRTKQGVDLVYSGRHALYFSRLASKASQSHLSRIVQLPMYQHMTIRNWNTTTKLLSLIEG